MFVWQKGQYCIGKRGSCKDLDPAFIEGTIVWDDEDHSNGNRVSGAIPDGKYDHNTRMRYCCRSDGSVNNAIALPNTMPLFLWPNIDSRCQEVIGMSSRLISLLSDDEDHSNDDACYGDYPFVGGHCNVKNIRQYLCYYTPK